MKKIKFKQLATFSLCCSLLVNSLTGVTAVAETMTIESSPTVESKEQTEDTKETAENEVTETLATETSEAPTVESQEEKETSADVVEKKKQEAVVGDGNSKTAEDTNVGESLVQPKQISPKATVNFPQLTYQFGFIDETGKRVDASTINLAYDIWAGESFITNDWKTLSIEKGRLATTNNNLKEITYYKQSLNTVSGRTWQYSAANLTFFPPKYYEKMSVYNKNGAFDTAYLFPNINVYTDVSSNVFTENATKSLSRYFELTKSGNQSFVFNQTTSSAPADVKVPEYLREITFDPDRGYVGNGMYHMLDKPVYYYLTYRKVTEKFVDGAGVAITPPTGFTQNKKTPMTSNNFTYTSAKALPDTYQANGKTYVLKGWYKGKTKPATLKTTKTPSYAVTYDGNDDLNVVYEVDTAKDYKFPSRTVNFQFVNEAGTIISPTPFTITTDLQQEINSTYTKLGSITGANSGNTKQVTIPAKTIRADVSLGGVNNYGTTNTRITIPKFYENISVYTGSAYTQATLNRYSTVDNTLIDNPASNAPLYYGLSKMTATQFKMDEFDSTTTIPEQSKYLYNRLYVSGANHKFSSYHTPVGTIYYQLTNRKVTENFIDTNGVKITAPTGFTQGKKTSITNTDYTFAQSGTLPSTYKTSN
ncbi:WxL domain-containing protein, partial [Enterococcus faecalis]|nr:WxL domain-containing protein [Enterococcus faecalis]